MGLERWSGTFSRKAWHCRTISFCPIRLPENDASLRVITSGVLRASILDIPRLDVKGVAVELVNDAIKHALLTLGIDSREQGLVTQSTLLYCVYYFILCLLVVHPG